MDGVQLRVREIRNHGSIARYSNVDLGRDQGSGRGDVSASFFRLTAEKRYECFTFLPDTIHNRMQLLQRQVELAEWDGDAWLLVDKQAMNDYLAPARVLLSPRAAIGGEELKADGAMPEAVAGTVAEKEAVVVVNSIEDFLGLPKESQLEALAREDFPVKSLMELLECKDLSPKVRNAAIRKAEKIVGTEAVA